MLIFSDATGTLLIALLPLFSIPKLLNRES